MENIKGWGQILFGVIIMAGGLMIVVGSYGLVPIDKDVFLAPPVVTAAAGMCFTLGGLALVVPEGELPWLRSLLNLLIVSMIAVVAHWAGFGSGAGSEGATSISVGPVGFSGEGGITGRICFGLSALILDGVLVYMIYARVRDRLSS